MATNMRNTISQLKRLLGKKFNRPDVQKDLVSFPFEVRRWARDDQGSWEHRHLV